MRETPCLQRMLGASSPQRFAADCAKSATEEGHTHHQAKQDTHTRVIHCAWPEDTSNVGEARAHAAPLCALAGMNRQAATAAAVAGTARSTSDKLRRRVRLMGLTDRQANPILALTPHLVLALTPHRCDHLLLSKPMRTRNQK